MDAGSSISMEEYPNGFALYSIEFGNERGILNDHTSKKRNLLLVWVDLSEIFHNLFQNKHFS